MKPLANLAASRAGSRQPRCKVWVLLGCHMEKLW